MATRTRTRPVTVVNGTWQNEARFKNTLSLRWNQSGPYEARRLTDTMTDEVTPDFLRRRAKGEVFCKAMTKVTTEENTFLSAGTAEDASYVYSGSACFVSQPGNIIPYYPIPTARLADIDRMKKIAGTQAMSRITSEEVLLPATLGELRSTLKMLVDALRAAINIRKLLFRRYYWTKMGNHAKDAEELLMREIILQRRWRRQGKKDNTFTIIARLKRQAKAAAKKASSCYLKAENAWMLARMGYRPFYGECQNLYNAITKVNSGVQRQTFRGKSSDIEYSFKDLYSRAMNGGTYKFDRSYVETISAKAGVLCQVRFSGFPDTFGLTKLPQTVWELTTLSWAVDYFFNVAELIGAMTPDSYWTPLVSWTTVKALRVQEVRYNSRVLTGFSADNTKGGTKVLITTEKIRTPGVSIGFAFRPRLNLAKYIDLACVGRQQFSKVVKLLSKALIAKKRKKV